MMLNGNAAMFSTPDDDGGAIVHEVLDVDHLDRQTFGDPELRREILNLFVAQSRQIEECLKEASPAERKRLAHTLKGSSRSVGAFSVAGCAEEIELQADDDSLLETLALHLEEARRFIATLG